MLTIGDAESIISGPQPVKTVPSHFSNVNLATDADMESVFGGEDNERYWIGNPLDMETKLCLNLEEFVKRSNGIFGKSGTGKTFLTRILLIGMLQKSKAVNLIFDMHNEYGWAGSSEGQGRQVKALKQLFPAKVAVFTLDEKNARLRGASPDVVVRIGYSEIKPEDISLLRETLNLTEQAVEAAYSLYRRLGANWILSIVNMTDSDESDRLIKELSIHEGTFQNLKRGLNTIKRLPFIEPESQANAVDEILSYLDHGVNVVLEFGICHRAVAGRIDPVALSGYKLCYGTICSIFVCPEWRYDKGILEFKLAYRYRRRRPCNQIPTPGKSDLV